ncbi:hypothetical protein KRM28CT15_52530 [Krasilnikovia sp. M28-CT-15]
MLRLGSKARPGKFILRADGGKTTFATWGANGGKFNECKTYKNGKYTVAKSRKPYI